MALTPGAHLGSYEVTVLLGEGGMGAVYRARDSKLNRDVALKVLPDAVATDPERLARFRREAQTLAALNHPHVGQIYGFEDAPSDAGPFLVLELVDGPTLADRIAAGALPIDEVLPIARQIAEALEAAHEQGIVHRDLKPANVKVRDDGTVKVLDFGLAKALDQDPKTSRPHDLTASPTITSPAMTRVGVILGTAAYMAPEQAKGRAVDRRADIWAFGCVLYEMLTGTRPFGPLATPSAHGSPASGGDDLVEILSAVVTAEPDWSRLPAPTPSSVRRLLRRCLQKDRQHRLQHIGDARLDLSDLATDDSAAIEARADRASSAWFAWRAGRAVAALALVAAGVAGSMLWRTPTTHAPRAPLRFTVFPEPGTLLSFSSGASAAIPEPALSPDQRWLAFPAGTGSAQRRLWVRRLDEASAREIPGTDGATQPFWWPDSRAVGFFAQGRIRRVAPEGGPVEAVCCGSEISQPFGVAVSGAGLVLLGGSDGIQRVTPGGSGSTPEAVVTAPEGARYRHPAFLPGGETFLFTATGPSEQAGIYVGWLDGRRPVRIAPDVSRAVYLDGHVFYVRNRVLVAHAFDSRGPALAGTPTALAGDFALSTGGYTAASTGASGMLAFSPGEPDLVQFLWTDRRGASREPIGEPGPYLFSRLSPTDDRIAFDRYDLQRDTRDIWVMQTATGIASRLTFDPADDANPVWDKAGDRVYFMSYRSTSGIYARRVDGGAPESLVAPTAGGWPRSVSQDGRFLSMTSRVPPWDALALPLGATSQAPLTIAGGEGSQQDGQFAPGAPFIAFQSDESGRPEVFVQRFPEGGQRWQVSTAGGSMPRWRSDGKALYFVGGDDMLMAVAVTLGDTFLSERPVPLFRLQGIGTSGRGSYSPARDGQRFLLAEPVLSRMGISIVTDWRALLPDASR